MSATKMFETWSLVLESGAISDKQSQQLLQAIQHDKGQDESASDILIDDLVIHQLLKTMAESEESREAFVARCMQKIREQKTVTNTPDIATRPNKIVDTKRSLDIATGKRGRAKWLLGVLALATAILIGCFVIIWQPQENKNNQARQEPVNRNAADSQTNDSDAEVGEEPDLELPSLVDVEQQSEMDDEDIQVIDFEVVAMVNSDSDAVWETNDDDENGLNGAIRAGVYKLKEGLAVFRFAGGELIVLSGPAEIEIDSSSRVTLQRGSYMIEAMNADSELVVTTRDAILDNFERTTVSMYIDNRGSEMLLTEGDVNLVRRSEIKDEPLEMQKADLNYAFVNNAQNDESPDDAIVPVIVAHGPKRYFAQMGVGVEKKTSASPNEFKQLVENFYSEQDQQIQQLDRFNKMFDDLRKQFNDDGGHPSSEYFNGFSLQKNFQINNQGTIERIQELREQMKKQLNR